MKRVLVDTDVCLDLLSNREPHVKSATRIFSLADKGKLKIAVCSLSFANLHYLLSRIYSTDQSRRKLAHFKTIVDVVAVDEKVIEMSLQSDFRDFEDAIQYYSAIRSNIQVLLTRNIKDYRFAKIAVLAPEMFLKTIEIE